MSTPENSALLTNARLLSAWMFGCCGLVFIMIMIGAITRLTESGLSMVEWRPLIGMIPPLSEAEWNRVFDIYKQTPEFQQVNSWMGLADFQNIFFWEWFHRVWGRVIGLAYGIPLIVFWLQGRITPGHRLRCLALFILVVVQGIMGWYMVESGLVDEPAVSHYRLAAHLSLAFLLLCLTFWQGLVFMGASRNSDQALYRHSLAIMPIILITVLWGAFVAGKDAGLIYNEFPMMGHGLVPPEMWHLSPAWLNFFENHAGVQFTHRWLGVLAFLAVISVWGHGIMRKPNESLFHLLGFAVLAQLGLGVATLLSGVWLPLAAAHQAGAALLLMVLTWCLYRMKQ